MSVQFTITNLLNRSGGCLLLGWLVVGLLACTGCQGLGQMFGSQSELDITRARQFTNGGLEALDDGKLNNAVSYFHQALEHSPSDRRIRTHLADTYTRKKDYGQAIAQMQHVVESSNDPNHNVTLGELYLSNNQLLPASRQAQVALSRNRKLPGAWVLHGKTQFAKGDLPGALADYHRAMGLDPEIRGLALHISQVYREMDRPMRALATVEHMLTRYPLDQQPESALIEKSAALMELDQTHEAINVLTQATRRDDATAAPYIMLAQAQQLAGQFSDARTTFNRTRQLFPNREELDLLAEHLRANESRVSVASASATSPHSRK